MKSKLIPSRLSDYLKFRNGKNPPQRSDTGSFPVFGSNGLIGFCEEANAPARTIIIGRVGSYCGSIHFARTECWVTDNALIAEAKRPDEAEFWRYTLENLKLNHLRAGSGQPLLNQSILNSIQVAIPGDAAVRERIGRDLDSLERKILLNGEINQTLERLAHALFRSWFVDFLPVRERAAARAEGRDPLRAAISALSGQSQSALGALEAEDYHRLENLAGLFPDEFRDSDAGEIPHSWQVAPLGTLTTYLSRGILPKYDEAGVLVLNQKCVRDNVVDISKARRHDASMRRISGRELSVGDVLVNSTGVGTLGRVAQVFDLPEPMVVDSHVTVVRSGPAITSNYLGLELARRQSEIEQLGEGSTGQTELSRAKLAGLMIVVPPREILEHFDSLTLPLRQRISVNLRENQTLAQLRDTLLPKLISGEISSETAI